MRLTLKIAVAVIAVLQANTALGCSGPGASELIRSNILISHIGYGLGFLVLLANTINVRQTRRWWRWACVMLVYALLNPALLASALSGDCGYVKVTGSILFCGGAALYALNERIELWLARRRQPVARMQ